MTDKLVNEAGYRIGESHPNTRIPTALVERIRSLRDDGLSYDEICDRTGVLSVATVKDICLYRRRIGLPTVEPPERRHGHLRRGRRK